MKASWGVLVLVGLVTACAGDGSGGDGSGGGGTPGTGGNVGPQRDGGADCMNTCEVNGGQECSAPGFRRCTDTNGDGCLEWEAVVACENACVNGQCVDCSNDCEEGAVQCGAAGGVLRCVASADADPCFEWGAEEGCEPGESCTNGECRPASDCENECLKVGDQRCNGAGVQTCVEIEADDCLHWGPVADCLAGESCSVDACRPVGECVEECQANSVRCDGPGVSTCGNFDDDACNEWGAPVPCAGEEVCSNGACAGACANECGQEGLRQCVGNDFQTCGNFDDDACLEWGLATPCENEQTCSNGQCRAACVNECADGTRQCAAGGAQTCGNFDDDDCFEWSEVVPCDLNESCSNGECSLQCSNECRQLNGRQCAGAGFQNCGNFDQDPCLEWGEEQGCPAGQVCANGECAGRCVNECAEGSLQCAGNGTQTCGNFDEDPCLEWASVTPCPGAEVCSNGRCEVDCANECVLGSTRCAPGGVQTCGQADADACTDWAQAVPCAGGQVCSNGVCAQVCVDECPNGAARCSANGVERCGNFDGDGCSEWSLAAPCPGGLLCSSGACVPTCSDECARGAIQCAGNGFQSCGESDGDDCLEWGPIAGCQAGTSCSAGVCSQFCSDECNNGATRCGNGGVQVCGNFDDDNCRDWGPAVPCAGDEVCANGRCAAGCANECANGDARCEGNGVQRCGNFDNDQCLEFAAPTPCAGGQICADGACRDIQGSCMDDAGCPGGLICSFGACVPGISCQNDADCPEGEQCDVQGGNVCRREVPSGIGDACAVDADCVAGLTCVNAEDGGYCTLGCNADFPCPTGSTCYVVDESVPDQGACLTDCASDEACPMGQACFATGGPLGGACFLSECRVDADCAANALVDAVCEAGQCVQTNGCDLATGEGCADGLQCWNAQGTGVCLAGCSIFEGPRCPGMQRCVPVSVDGTGYCTDAGAAGLGDACGLTDDCGDGLFCLDDGVGNRSCRTLCNVTTPGDTCGNDVCTSLGGDVGVCIVDCTSDCNAGDTRCGGGGVEACGQSDDDLCLEWLPGVRCGAGESCSELSGACEPACRNDVDCANPLVPSRCVQGACQVESACDPSTGMGCVAPDQCFLATNNGDGVCLETCDPLGNACAGGERCLIFGGSGYCGRAGNVPAGGACESSADCVAGAGCFDDGVGVRCYTLCDFEAGAACAAGAACTDLGIDGRLGVCVEGCQDECLDGSNVCSMDGAGTQSCGQFDDDGCLDLGPVTPCGDELRCNPNTVACEYYCDIDAHCPASFGVPYQCVDNQCVARDCNVGMNNCAPGVAGTACLPADVNDPGAGGICLVSCNPLLDGRCGANGRCDYVPTTPNSVAFACLPAGVGGEFEDCSEGSCSDGFGCLPFDDGNGGTLFACVAYCDTRAGNRECAGLMGTACSAVPFFPNGTGVCLPE